jgi:protein-tyrosine phosphatase
MNDIVLSINQQDPPEEHRFGITQLADWLFLGGEEDVCQVLDQVDIWIDLRHLDRWNRKIFLPNHVVLVRSPFKDGDLEKAKEILPMCKDIAIKAHKQGKKVLVSCHAGVSRSALLALMILCDFMNAEEAFLKIKFARPHVEFHDNFSPIVRGIFNKG